MILFEQLQQLLKIKDDEVRPVAVLSWYGTLSVDERRQVSDWVSATVAQIVEAFQPIAESLEEVGSEIVKAIQVWIDNNPEIRAYVAELEKNGNQDKKPEQLLNPDLRRVDIGDGIYLEYDVNDGWFAICDEDWARYDRGGAVSFSLESLDSLIKALQLLKESRIMVPKPRIGDIVGLAGP